MAQVSSSFILRSKYPNFERDSFKTLADMRDVPSTWMDEGHISYCMETGKHYIFSTKNSNNGLNRWFEIPFVVNPQERKVLNIESVNDLKSLTCNKGSLVYINNEKEYYVYNGSNFEKLIDINIDLSNYYDKSRIGTWSLDTNLVEYIDNKYANKNDVVSTDILRSYATESFVEQKIGSIVDEYVTIESFESTLESYVDRKIGDSNIDINNRLNEYKDSTDNKFSNYATIGSVDEKLANYATIGSVDEKLVNYATIGSVDEKLVNYTTIGSVDEKFSNYATIGSVDEKLTDYITREEFNNSNSDTDNSISPDTIKDINNKISTVSAATGAVKQSLDNYKVEVENKYVKTTVLESDYVKGSTFQNNAAITTNRLNELEDLIYSSGGVSLKSDLEEYKEFVENTYAKPEDISSKLNNYAPAEENRNKWISSDLAGDLSGLTGQEVAARAYSYNAVLDQILFGKFTPEISDPYVDVQLKDDWDGKGYIKWYDEEKRIIVVKSGSTGPDGGDFLPINAKDAIISYPKGIDLSTNFTNGILPSTNLKQNSVGFCKIQDENGEWTYYRKDNNIYHVPTTLEVGEYRYYMAAYFQKGSPALNNEGFIVDEWNENTAVESENYITLIASKPTFYNTKSGLIENPLVFWSDNMVDYMTLPPTCHAEQIFMLPKKVKELYIWNDIKGDYALVPMEYQRVEGVITNNLIPSYFDEIIGDDGYYMYKYDVDKHGHRGEIKIKVVF